MGNINEEKFRMNYINVNHLVRLYDENGIEYPHGASFFRSQRIQQSVNCIQQACCTPRMKGKSRSNSKQRTDKYDVDVDDT